MTRPTHPSCHWWKGGGTEGRKLVGMKRKAQWEPGLPGAGPPAAALSSACSSCSPTGEQIKRVKPKRTTSFFSRQLSMGQGSYTVVQPAESPEQS